MTISSLYTARVDNGIQNDTTSYIPIPELVFPVSPFQRIAFTYVVFTNVISLSAGIKFSLDTPGSEVSFTGSAKYYDLSSLTAMWFLSTSGTPMEAPSALDLGCFECSGSIYNGNVAGDITLQFAQVVADSNTNDILIGSYVTFSSL
jgi:hypothetical protein